jgi:DnaJ-class molecular chaperone
MPCKACKGDGKFMSQHGIEVRCPWCPGQKKSSNDPSPAVEERIVQASLRAIESGVKPPVRLFQ